MSAPTGIQGEEESFEVPASCNRMRADKALHSGRPELSRSFIQKLFAAGLVWRETEALTKSDKVWEGDLLQFSIPPARPLALRGVEIPLRFLYEDEDYVVVDKAPGMVVHPGAGTGEDTLVHALLHHCRGSLAGIAGVERPGIVHRLDKETSGVLVVVKTDRAYLDLSRQFSERSVEKVYTALVAGSPPAATGVMEDAIGRHPTHRTKMTVRQDGRSSRTDWEVVQRFPPHYTLLRLRLHTGRTHQIRVHCAHHGFPLVGDSTYGFRARDEVGKSAPRVLLHATRLVFRHVATGALLPVESPPPQDFQDVLRTLLD